MNAQDGDLVILLSECRGHLIDHNIVGRGFFPFQIGEDADSHRMLFIL